MGSSTFDLQDLSGNVLAVDVPYPVTDKNDDRRWISADGAGSPFIPMNSNASLSRIRITFQNTQTKERRYLDFTSSVGDVDVDMTGRKWAIVSDKSVTVYDPAQAKTVYRAELGAETESVAMNGPGTVVAVCTKGGIKVLDGERNRPPIESNNNGCANSRRGLEID